MRLMRFLSILLCIVTVLLILAGCDGTEEAKNADKAQTWTYTDSAGRAVALPAHIDKVAPSGSYAQIMLMTLCPEKLVGLSDALSRNQKKFLKEYLQELPVLGKYFGKNVTMNFEEVIRLCPDVIIDIGEVKDNMAEELDQLQELTGIPTIFIETDLFSLPDTYAKLGEVLGCGERASELGGYVTSVLELAETSRSALSGEAPVSVLYGDGEYGLNVIVDGTAHSEVLDAVGVRNVAVGFNATGNGTAEVWLEQVYLWDPDVIVFTVNADYGEIYELEDWRELSAVRNKKVYEIPGAPYNWIDQPPSVQRILGILWLGNLIYPRLYDFDMAEKAIEFYKLFYGYDMERSEAVELMSHSTFAN